MRGRWLRGALGIDSEDSRICLPVSTRHRGVWDRQSPSLPLPVLLPFSAVYVGGLLLL